MAFFTESCNFWRSRRFGGQVEYGICGYLDVDERMTVRHRARECVPCAMNVLQGRGGIGCFRCSGDRVRRLGILSVRKRDVDCGDCKQQAKQFHTNSGFEKTVNLLECNVTGAPRVLFRRQEHFIQVWCLHQHSGSIRNDRKAGGTGNKQALPGCSSAVRHAPRRRVAQREQAIVTLKPSFSRMARG